MDRDGMRKTERCLGAVHNCLLKLFSMSTVRTIQMERDRTPRRYYLVRTALFYVVRARVEKRLRYKGKLMSFTSSPSVSLISGSKLT